MDPGTEVPWMNQRFTIEGELLGEKHGGSFLEGSQCYDGSSFVSKDQMMPQTRRK